MIYIYIYVEGHVVELAPPHTQSVWGLKEKRFKLQESGMLGSKDLGFMYLESQFVLLANHNQNNVFKLF